MAFLHHILRAPGVFSQNFRFCLRCGVLCFVVLSCPVRRQFTCFMLSNHCDCFVYPVSHILCMSSHTYELFYGSPPQLLFNEIADFETSSRSYLLKCGVPCHLDGIVRYSFATKEVHDDIFFMVSFLVSSSHETFVKQIQWFGGGLS